MALDNINLLISSALSPNSDKILLYRSGGLEASTTLLSLTNSALTLSGVYLDPVNQRVGIGVPNPAYPLDVANAGRIGGIVLSDSGSDNRITASNPYLFLMASGTVLQMQGGGFSTGQYNTTARFDIKGKGSTSATTSLLVQNSAGSTAFQVKDNLQVGVGDGFGGGDGIRFEPGNNSRIVFRQGIDRLYLTRSNGDQLHVSFNSGPTTMIGSNGICNDGSGVNFWSLEGAINSTVAMDTTKYLKVYVAGVPYKIAVCV